MRALLFMLFLLPALAGLAQVKTVDVDKQDVSVVGDRFYTIGGTPVTNTKYVRLVEGSPFFNDAWMTGKLAMGDGRLYDSLRLRLDLVENELHYLDATGKELIATTAVRAITLRDSVSGIQFHFIHSSFLQLPKSMEEGWYQLLAAGPATLYKRIVKTTKENKPYGSATVEQFINTYNQYFVLVNAVFTHIKKFKELPDVLAGKKTESDTYIKSQNLSGRSDADYSSLVSYYNRLVENK